jgi:hypothetical protein
VHKFIGLAVESVESVEKVCFASTSIEAKTGISLVAEGRYVFDVIYSQPRRGLAV